MGYPLTDDKDFPLLPHKEADNDFPLLKVVPKQTEQVSDVMAKYGIDDSQTENQKAQQNLLKTFEAKKQKQEDDIHTAATNTAKLYFENRPLELKGFNLSPKKSKDELSLSGAGKQDKFSLTQLKNIAPFQQKVAELKNDIQGGKLITYTDNTGQLKAARPKDKWDNFTSGVSEAWHANEKVNAYNKLTGQAKIDFLKENKPDKEYLPEKSDESSAFYTGGSMIPMTGKMVAAGATGAVMAAAVPETAGFSTAGLPALLAWASVVPDMAKQGQMNAEIDAFHKVKDANPDIKDEDALKIAEHAGVVGYAEGLATGTAMNFLGQGSLPSNTGQGLWKAAGQFLRNQPQSIAEISALNATGSVLGDEAKKALGVPITSGEMWDKAGKAMNSGAIMQLAFNVAHGVMSAPKFVKAQSNEVLTKVNPETLQALQEESVKEGVLTPEQVAETNTSLQDYKAARAKIPESQTHDEERTAVIAGLIQKKTNLEKAKTNVDKSYHKEIDEQIESANQRIELAKNSSDPIKYAESDDLDGSIHFTPKAFTDLTKSQKEGVEIPKDYGIAEVEEHGEGENKTYTPKASYIVEQGGLKPKKEITIEGEQKFKDKSKAQEAADNALREHYYENGLQDNLKPEKKSAVTVIKPSENKTPEIIEKVQLPVQEEIKSEPIITPNEESQKTEVILPTKDEGVAGITTELNKGAGEADKREVISKPTEETIPEKTIPVENIQPTAETGQAGNEPPIAGGSPVSETGGNNRVGVSHASLTDLAQRLGLKEPERGQRLTPEQYAERGRKILNAEPEIYKQVEQGIKNDKQPTADDIGVARAHWEDLVRNADNALRKYGIDSPEFEATQKEANIWGKDVVKKMGTKASEPFTALQGERDLDTDSFVTVKRTFEETTGSVPTAEQEKKIKELTETNQKLKQQTHEAEAKLIEETDKAFKAGVEEGKKKSTSSKAKTVANKLRETAKLHKPDSFSAATPASIVWDAAVEIVAKSIEAGGKIAEAIEEGLKYVRESEWYKDLNDAKKQKAETDFKQWHNDNTNSINLEDLQARFIDKTDNKFTIDEAKSIWQYAKENYLDKGVSYRDMISQVSNDLGLSWRQISEAITTPKTKRISDEMWKKQSEYRRNQNATKTWVEDQSKSLAGKTLRKVSGVFRGVAVFGHGGIFIGTHAAPTLFQPTTWNKVIPAFFRGWKYAYGNVGSYERAMQELQNRPLYTVFQRAGLKNNPERLKVEEYQQSQKYLGKLGLAGERGFNAIKVLRQDLAEYHYNKLKDIEKQDPKVLESIANLVNNGTGATNLNIPEWVNEVTFAGGMEAARWGKLTSNPAKATATALKALFVPDKVSTADKVFAKVWASRVGQQLATYTGMLLANAAIQNTLNPKNPVNMTDPNKPDFLKFKFGDLTIDPTSGMRGTANFIYGLGKIPFETKKELHGDNVIQAAGKQTFGYGRGKLSPLYSTAIDFYTKTDFSGNPLPFNNEKPSFGKHQLTWGEYAWQKAPLPIAEAANVTYKSAIDNGADKVQLNHILNGMASGLISGTTGFRVGEYDAEKSKHSPFTDVDNKDPVFKYWLDKGMSLPNTSLQSEVLTDPINKTKYNISDYPPNIQDQYTQIHKDILKTFLGAVKEQGVVYINKYKNKKGETVSDVSLSSGTESKKIDDLTKEELAQVLKLAQSEATTQTKGRILIILHPEYR